MLPRLGNPSSKGGVIGVVVRPLETNSHGHRNEAGVSARREHAVVTGLGEKFDIAVLAEAECEARAKIHAGSQNLVRTDQIESRSGCARRGAVFRIPPVEAAAADDVEVQGSPVVHVEGGIDSYGPEFLTPAAGADLRQRAAVDVEVVEHG